MTEPDRQHPLYDTRQVAGGEQATCSMCGMTSDRPYRKGLSYDDAQHEIVNMAGTQFDPLAIETFLAETDPS